MSHRRAKFASTLRQCLAEVFTREISDPELASLIILNVDVSPDLRSAVVFVVSPTGRSLPGESLERARGFIRGRVARKMFLKYVPQISFAVPDQTVSSDTDDETGQGSSI